MRATFLSVLFFTFFHGSAQRPCATLQYNNEQKSLSQHAVHADVAIESFIKQQTQNTTTLSAENSTSSNSIIKIPVVVHVLYSTETENLTDAQIQNGLAALNRDFRRQNSDTANTPDRFKSLAADVEIEFVLATTDPKGRKTTGIIRRQTGVKEWRMDDKIKYTAQGGADAWDARFYLNIWIGPMRNLLGYASMPGSVLERDGIVINTPYFSTLTAPAPYNLGRTVVHEVGHWLGLKHIWGDTYCGDDLVQDTPKQGNFTSGCPTGFRTSCSNNSTGDMYMNYMDFTNDACMNLFTVGQKARMQTLFYEGGPRASLLSSKGLSASWVEEAPVVEIIKSSNASVKVYPNPAATFIIIQLGEDASWMGKRITFSNATGIPVKEVVLTTGTQKIWIGDLKAGVYFMQAKNETQKLNLKIIKL